MKPKKRSASAPETAGNELAGRAWRAGGEELELGLHVMRRLERQNPEPVWTRYCGFLILAGEGRYVDADGRSWPLRPGVFGQHLPGRWHRIERDRAEEWLEYSVSLNAALLNHFAALGGVDMERPVLYPPSLPGWPGRFRQLLAELRGAAPEALPGVAQGALELLWRLRRVAPQTDLTATDPAGAALITAAREYLAREASTPAGLAQLAARFGLSYSHFRRRFRELTGQSPGQYRLAQRLAQARTLLSERRHRVSEIAAAVGYADAFVFSKQFKKFYGVSPAAYAAGAGREE